jgi:hypothetical protein
LRKAFIFLLFVAGCLLLISGLFITAGTRVEEFGRTGRDMRQITAALKLTDISFSTDARYTRHPSQADLFSAFQDFPGSIEHFPSGSVVAPPDFSTLGTRITTRLR